MTAHVPRAWCSDCLAQCVQCCDVQESKLEELYALSASAPSYLRDTG